VDVLLHDGDLGGFRTSALELLRHQVHPAAIAWSSTAGLAVPTAGRGPAGGVSNAAASVVPRSFLRLVDLALLHSDPQRFDLLYRLLWRVVHEPRLKDDRDDYDMQRARKMAAAVRREVQTLQRSAAFVSVAYAGSTLACAWTDPHFHTTEAFALWVARRHPDADFLVASPERCVLSRARAIRLLPRMLQSPRNMQEWCAALRVLHGSDSGAPA
jgi:uracil-DNA glycosylase